MAPNLHTVICKNNTDAIKEALENGADINARDDYGATPLLHALRAPYITETTIQCLFQYNPDVNMVDNYRESCLYAAIDQKNIEWITFLLDWGANPNAVDTDDTPLSRAMSHMSREMSQENIELIKLLLDWGANPNELHRELGTPLLRAIVRNNLEVIKLLLDRGADINARDERGIIPLLEALIERRVRKDTIKYLLQYKPDTDIVDKKGNTSSSALRNRSDLSNSVKGEILGVIEPSFYALQSDEFILWFINHTKLPRELYDMIMLQVVTQPFPEIPLEEKSEYIKAHMISLNQDSQSDQPAEAPIRFRLG